MLPSTIDLNYFYEVVKAKSFSRAAENLNISQPSVSLAIQRLEKLLNTALLIRHRQGVTPTRAGQILFDNVQKWRENWNQTKLNILAANTEVTGKVIIGCHSILAPFMSPFISTLLAKHAALEIHLQSDLSVNIIENLLYCKLDIGVVMNPQRHQDIIVRKIMDTEISFWEKKDAAIQHTLNAESPVVICDTSLPQTQHLLHELRKTKPQIRISNVNSLEAIASMAAEGCGVGILPSCYAKVVFGDKLSPIENTPAHYDELCLTYRPENKDVIAIYVVVEAINQFLKTTLQG